MKHHSDTIFALASGKGRAGVGVIRLSGSEVRAALTSLAGDVPRARTAALRSLSVDSGGARARLLLDQGIVLYFPAPHSFTGEDVGELHVHASPAVIEAVFRALQALGLRPAEPGEFTRRSFDNGKMDLTEVEGLADLIAAETEGQRAQAVHQMRGGLATLYETWRARVLEALAWIEAQIDFSDEDLPPDLMGRVEKIIKPLEQEMGQHLGDGHRGERVRDGVSVVILGPPNVGKSSLLNALARRDVAIVSEQSGTTRDILETHLDLAGMAVCMADTAGLREAASGIEREGIRRALLRAEEADIRIYMMSPDCPRAVLDAAFLIGRRCDHDFQVLNKSDLVEQKAPDAGDACLDVLRISVKTGAGMEDLLSALTRKVETLTAVGEGVMLTRARHRQAVEDARCALGRFLAEGSQDVGLRAEALRMALRALERLAGRTDVEEVLGLIFSEFCIGK